MMFGIKTKIICTAAVLSFAIFSACSLFGKRTSNEADVKAAMKVIGEYHQLISAEQYDDAYRLSTDSRNPVPGVREKLIQRFRNLRQQFGVEVSSSLVSSDPRQEVSGRKVLLRYETKYAKGSQNEEFDVAIHDGIAYIEFK